MECECAYTYLCPCKCVSSAGTTVIKSTNLFILSWSKLHKYALLNTEIVEFQGQNMVWSRRNVCIFLLLDEFVIEVFEFLKAVIILKKFIHWAVLTVQQFLDGGASLAAVGTPESAV